MAPSGWKLYQVENDSVAWWVAAQTEAGACDVIIADHREALLTEGEIDEEMDRTTARFIPLRDAWMIPCSCDAGTTHMRAVFESWFRDHGEQPGIVACSEW